YQGRRVLEFGSASGAVCFGLEKRGAEVVTFDLAPNAQWDIVPIASLPDLGLHYRNRTVELRRLRHSFWFRHAALGSPARVVYGQIYEVPAAIGPVDVAFFGSILLHLRDPFLALANGARFAREAVVVTDLLGEPWLPEFPTGKSWSARLRRRICSWL